MDTVVCVGGGKFGFKAAMESRARGDRVILIDNDRGCLASSIIDRITLNVDDILDAAPGEALLFIGEGASTLDDLLARWVPDLVVPASKGHLAAHLAVEHCKGQGRKLAPLSTLKEIMDALPPDSVQLCDERYGVVVTSFMQPGNMCLDDCVQPGVCPVTGATISTPMYSVVEEALKGSVDRGFVLATTGTERFGGMKGPDLKHMLSSLEKMEDGMTCGIATACRCHGIINLFTMLGPAP